MEQSQPASPTTVKREFVVSRNGKSFVLYAGLLDLAHSQGLRAIRTRVVQIPSEDNAQTAICTAEVETERGTFSGIGDASPANVARAMLTCTIRLAETRAKARALRDAVNVGVTAFEEIDGETGEITTSAQAEPTPIGERRAVAASSPRAVTASAPTSASASAKATDAQVRAIYSIAADSGLTKEDVVKYTGRHYTATPETLTRAQASETITALKAGAATH